MNTFVAIVLGFVLVVVVFIAALLIQNRRLAGYAGQVMDEARRQQLRSASACSEVSRAGVPGSVKTCRIVPEAGRLRVVLELTNGQRYELTR